MKMKIAKRMVIVRCALEVEDGAAVTTSEERRGKERKELN